MAFKMATGSGKTVVMAMLIAWQALNKLEDRQDARFSDAFLIVTPGITIRDRLRVLLPSDPDNYYRQRDILPSDLLERLGQATIVITNYHAFLLREKGDAATADEGHPGAEANRVRSPRRQTRWCVASAATSATRSTSSSSTTKRTTAIAARPTAEKETLHRRRAERGAEARGRSPRLDLRARGGEGEARRARRLRPLGDAVLPERFRLAGGDALPVGGVRLLADRRHRERHRQGAARAGGATTR